MGRGQRGSTWCSERGKNLTFSLVLRPEFLDPTEQFDLNIVFSLAIWEVLSEYSYGIKIKWPNDLVHQTDGKLGGILIENIVGPKGLDYSVVGIGLNINQTEFKISGATSLFKITGVEMDRWEIFKLIIHNIESAYLKLKKRKIHDLKSTYIQNLFRLGTWQDYYDLFPFKGRILGVSGEGKLIIEKEDGGLNHYGFKEVRFL
jgi:BirA family biotin operon repressor/biotin-[acetyl-CoA-carboxylase] ligase